MARHGHRRGAVCAAVLLTLVTDWATAASTREGRARGWASAALHRHGAPDGAPSVGARHARADDGALAGRTNRRSIRRSPATTSPSASAPRAPDAHRAPIGHLGLGAYLVVREEATAGVMLAATVLSARALAPVDLAIANWKSFSAARQAWRTGSSSSFPAGAGRPHAPPGAAGQRADHRPDHRRARHGHAGSPRRQRRHGPGSALGVIGPSGPANRRSPAPWSASPSEGGVIRLRRRRHRPMGADALDARWATCRRISRCSTAPSPRTSRGSTWIPTRRPFSAHRGRRASTTSCCGCRAATMRASAGGPRPVRRPAAADRPGAGALRRPVPRRARRAEFQPRCRGRPGPVGRRAGGEGRGGIPSWSRTGRAP